VRVDFTLFGEQRNDPRAAEVGAMAYAALLRYIDEVVVAFQLCPFLHNTKTGLGKVGVVLEREPKVETALDALQTLGGSVMHLVYPIATTPAPLFEVFGGKLIAAVDKRSRLVHATFHPEMGGGLENGRRLIGVLRRAPDPFLQLIPEGFETSGTVMMGQELPPAPNHAEARFKRLTPADLTALTARLDELKRERAGRPIL
jgi:hypothetical protein